MNDKQTPRIAPSLIWREVDDNSVIVTPQSGKMRVLNGVGSTIWRLLTEEQPIAAIAEQVTAQYNVSLEQAQSDLSHFLDDLTARGLLEWGE